MQELSLIALREARERILPRQEMAKAKTEQVLSYVATNLSEKLEIKKIAQAVHVSPAHLRRLFHEACGECPRAAFNRLRMERAHELLQNPEFTLEFIAEQVGLSSASALVRAIRRHFGMAPGGLRQECKRRVALVEHEKRLRASCST